MKTPVVINGRAAIRREVGGVERVARELSTLLPRLDPRRYRVATPPRALAHRAGHLWEQTVLPALPAQIVYCPAMLGPVRSRRNVVCIHDAASVRHPEWYSRTYAAYQRRMLPRLARRAQLVITVSRVRARGGRRGARRGPGPGRGRPLGRQRGLPPRRRCRRGARSVRPRASVRAHGGQPDRAQEPRRAHRGGRRATPGGNRPRRRGLRPRLHARGRERPCGSSGTSTRRSCPGSTPEPPRSPSPPSTRASACPRWRRWPPESRWWRPTGERCRRCAATPRSWSTRPTRAP